MQNQDMNLSPDKLVGMSFGKILTQEEFDEMRKKQGMDNTKVVKMPPEASTDKESLRRRLKEAINSKRT